MKMFLILVSLGTLGTTKYKQAFLPCSTWILCWHDICRHAYIVTVYVDHFVSINNSYSTIDNAITVAVETKTLLMFLSGYIWINVLINHTQKLIISLCIFGDRKVCFMLKGMGIYVCLFMCLIHKKNEVTSNYYWKRIYKFE